MKLPTHTRRAFRLVAALISALCATLPVPSHARLAVFVDGRVLKVEDAVLDGDHILLKLTGEASLRVPAVRIDRVVDDEVAVDTEPVGQRSCVLDFTGRRLPQGTPFAAEIEEAARNADLNPHLLAAVVRAESAFDPRAMSRAGACGLTQLMPAAAHDQRVADVFDPRENLRGGAAHLRLLLDRFDSLPLALAAYNAGSAVVRRHQGIPPYRETRDYVRRVLAWFCPEA